MMTSEADNRQHDPAIERARAAVTIDTPDPEHSTHVAILALNLFDQFKEPLQLPEEGRDLLAAAALWHDVGQRINLAEHHRASYDLIMEQTLTNFTLDERLIIANIARYHRGAHPAPEHTGYRNLPRKDRPLVDALAALLRIAEALDASHLQTVEEVICTDGLQGVTCQVIATSYPMMEVEHASARAGLFKQVFHRDITFIPVMRQERASRAQE